MWRKRLLISLVILLSLLLGIYFLGNLQSRKSLNMPSSAQFKEIRYIPIGDSYTIGNGVKTEERWPNLLVKHLNEQGIKIKLILNPAVSGYTVQDATIQELPLVETQNPDFVTVLIGANDSFRFEESQIYQKDLQNLLDRLEKVVGKNIVLITIPDYTKTPQAQEFSPTHKSQALENIIKFNQIIKDEAEKRGLEVADIFPISQTMTEKEDYILDGLHPSAKGYKKWEGIIFPVVYNKLK